MEHGTWQGFISENMRMLEICRINRQSHALFLKMKLFVTDHKWYAINLIYLPPVHSHWTLTYEITAGCIYLTRRLVLVWLHLKWLTTDGKHCIEHVESNINNLDTKNYGFQIRQTNHEKCNKWPQTVTPADMRWLDTISDIVMCDLICGNNSYGFMISCSKLAS